MPLIREIVNEKLIMTTQIADHWWETNVDEITDSGLSWLIRRHSYKLEDANFWHSYYVKKYGEKREIHKCKYCDQVALNYDGIMKEWLCSRHFNKYIKERC